MYAVVVISKTGRDMIRFGNYLLAEFFYESVKGKRKELEVAEVRLVDIDNPQDIDPEKIKPKRKKSDNRPVYWCPYCGEWEFFVKNDSNGYMVCRICGISDNDFYVKKYNHLWN